MKRLFIAVDPDESTRASIATISSGLRDSIVSRTTWVHPERLHLTLEFLGEVDEEGEQRAVLALAEPISVAPFRLIFDGLGFFPSRGSPRVLWLGLSEGVNDLRRVHQVLLGRLPAVARPAEPFNPHLTLARFRDRVPRAQLKEIGGRQALAGPCPIDRVTLYESRLSPKGPTYVALAEGLLK